ncbi:hypothetical protein INR49_021159 [Caranx melampygus]|nr:hypothetical protein INR49_021159 [Caranx melampygus]
MTSHRDPSTGAHFGPITNPGFSEQEPTQVLDNTNARRHREDVTHQTGRRLISLKCFLSSSCASILPALNPRSLRRAPLNSC